MRRSLPLAAVLLPLLLVPILSAEAQTTVTVVGDLQSELGCPGDWQPDCAATRLVFDANDGVWQGTFAVPAGSWQYKVAIDGTFAENYGAGGTFNGPSIALSLGAGQNVKFYYDHQTHWITSNVNAVIAIAAGNFQSELGCPGDWDPGCLRSWLQDPDGDGIYTLAVNTLPAGSYDAKVAIDEGWTVNYGAGGVENGPNIPFVVPTAGLEMIFSYDASSHVLKITPRDGTPPVCGRLVTVRDANGRVVAVQVAPSDLESGIWRVEFLKLKNATAVIDGVMGPFAQGAAPVDFSPLFPPSFVMRADKTDPAATSSVVIGVTNAAGLTTTCDPVVTSLVAEQPDAVALHANYPNPFNPQTTITYDVPEAGQVRLEILDLTGRRVATLVDGIVAAGTYATVWDGRTDSGTAAAGGTYLCRFQAGPYERTRLLTLLK